MEVTVERDWTWLVNGDQMSKFSRGEKGWIIDMGVLEHKGLVPDGNYGPGTAKAMWEALTRNQ